MNVATGGGDTNPNASYLNSRGMWATYLLLTFLIHIAYLCVPSLSVAWAWTLTNVTHTLLSFSMLHGRLGTPWETSDQAADQHLTHWEQIDHGLQLTATRKFLTIVPIVLFCLTSFYTQYSTVHFFINCVALGFALVPKLPQFHKVRLFGLNRFAQD